MEPFASMWHNVNVLIAVFVALSVPTDVAVVKKRVELQALLPPKPAPRRNGANLVLEKAMSGDPLVVIPRYVSI